MSITITTTSKETLVNAARRAMKNADANNKTVVLNHGNISSLVYPNDRMEKIISFLKLQELKLKLSLLASK
jgi:Cu/Ag efflux protein CusF